MNDPEEEHGWSVLGNPPEDDQGGEFWTFPNFLILLALGLVFGYWAGRTALPEQEKESVR